MWVRILHRLSGEPGLFETVKQQDIQANQTLMDSKVAEHLRHSVAQGMQSMQPAVMSMKATAQTLKDKLVATAEDLLRSQQQHLDPRSFPWNPLYQSNF